MLKHVLAQTAALPRHNKCQHDEGEDSNAVLSLLHWEAGVMNVQQRQTHISTCLHLSREGEGGEIYLAVGGGGVRQSNLKMFAG